MAWPWVINQTFELYMTSIKLKKLSKGTDNDLKIPAEGLPDNCVVNYFSCSAVYLSLDGMVDGVVIDKLFTKAQSAPTTAPLTTWNDASLAGIFSAMTNVTDKNSTCSANNDKEGTIKYNEIQSNVCERYCLKNDPVKNCQEIFDTIYWQFDSRQIQCTVRLEFSGLPCDWWYKYNKSSLLNLSNYEGCYTSWLSYPLGSETKTYF